MIIAMMYFDIALQPLDRRALDGWCWVLIGFYYCLSRAEALSNRCDGLSRGWGVHHGGGGVSRDGGRASHHNSAGRFSNNNS